MSTLSISIGAPTLSSFAANWRAVLRSRAVDGYWESAAAPCSLRAPISADLRAMERLDGRYYLLALCADDYVAGFPKQMEQGLPRSGRIAGRTSAVLCARVLSVPDRHSRRRVSVVQNGQ